MNKEIEQIIKNLQEGKSRTGAFNGEFYQTFKESMFSKPVSLFLYCK